MNIQGDLIERVQSQLDKIHVQYATLLKEEEKFAHVAGNVVINRIPEEIARAVLAKRSFVNLCEVSDFGPAATDPLFSGERLFFCPPEVGAHFDFEGRPQAEWLIGAAKYVFDFCAKNDLYPYLEPSKVQSASNGFRTATWSCAPLSIRWNRDAIEKLLNLRTFGEFNVLGQP